MIMLNLLTPAPKKPRKKPRRQEAQHQRAFFQWLRYQYPQVRKVTFHPANGGSRHALEAKLLKAEGVTPGVSDIICLYPRASYHGLVAEFKTKGNKLTESQQEFLTSCQELGYQTMVWYSVDEAKKGLTDYLKLN